MSGGGGNDYLLGFTYAIDLFFFKTGTHVAQGSLKHCVADDFELLNFLPIPPKCWDK